MKSNSLQLTHTGRRLSVALALVVSAMFAVGGSGPVEAAARNDCTAGITGVSPGWGLANTKVTITGCGLTGASEVLFGNVPASFKINSNTSITAYAPHGEAAGATVPVYANISTCTAILQAVVGARRDNTGGGHCTFSTSTVPSTASFSYPIGELDIYGPHPHYYQQGANDEWWQAINSGGHIEDWEAPDTLPFASASQTFYLTTAFADQSSTYPEGQKGSDSFYGQYQNAGDSGYYGASLQGCDVSNGASQQYGSCSNWDGNTGYWEDIPNTYTSENLNSPGNDGTAFGSLAVQAPPLDVSSPTSNLAATYRFAWTLQEADSHGYGGSLYRNSSGFSPGFNVVVAPVAYAQMEAQPYTILYQPPGDESKASYATTLGYGTDMKMGNSTSVSNKYSYTQTNNAKFDASIAYYIGVNFDNSFEWDHTSTEGFGTTDDATNESSDNAAVKLTLNAPIDTSLVPGSGATCASPTDCAHLVTPSPLAQYMQEPFWDDQFILNVHPQYRVYEVGSGQSMWIMKASTPTLADVTVRQLDNCVLGQWTDGLDPCLVNYSDAGVTYNNGTVAWKGSSCNNTPPQKPTDGCLELTPQEASRLLALDPFFVDGQSADVGAKRGIAMPPVPPYGASEPAYNEHPDEVDEAFDNTQKQTTGSGVVQTASTGYSDVETTNIGGGFTISGSSGDFKASESLTLTSGEKDQTDYSQQTQYSDSTANSNSVETTATVALNDVDNTTIGTSGNPMCTKCHNPMPNKPEVNVYLDRTFGGFMFQDPNAPAAPAVTTHNVRLYRLDVAYLNQQGSDRQALSAERFRDVSANSPELQAIATVVFLGFMPDASPYHFQPDGKITEIQLADVLGAAVHLPGSRAFKLLFGANRARGKSVTEGLLEKGLAKAMKLKSGVAGSYMKSAFPHIASNKVVTRGEVAQVLFAGLQGSCIQGCSYSKPAVETLRVANTVALSVGPDSGTVKQGGSSSTVVSTADVSGIHQMLKLSLRGLPGNAKASLSPRSVAAGKHATLQIRTTASTPPGTYPVTVIGKGLGGTYSATYQLTVKPLKSASKILNFNCSSSGPYNITCSGKLTAPGTPGTPGIPLANRVVTLTYAPPDGSQAIIHTVTTTGDGTIGDMLNNPPSGPPLVSGTWQVQASYGGDSTTKPGNGQTNVAVQGP